MLANLRLSLENAQSLPKFTVLETRYDKMSDSDTEMTDAGDGDDSDISSVFDPITPPVDQLRTYTVVHPPQLPEWTDIDGEEYKADWYQDCWRYTARAYSEFDGAGFEVRQMDIAKFGDEEVPDENDTSYWPPKYALGPPNETKGVWQGVLSKWDFPILEKAGFINYYPKAEDVYMKPLGRLADRRNPDKKTTKLIHPVLRRDMWRDIEDDEYRVMEPAILLATAILDDPATLAFFHAVADLNSMTEFDDATHGKCKVVSVPDTLTGEQEVEVFEKLLAMRNWTTWNVKPTLEMLNIGGYGVTRPRKNSKGIDVVASKA
jgi:hypothetical protein